MILLYANIGVKSIGKMEIIIKIPPSRKSKERVEKDILYHLYLPIILLITSMHPFLGTDICQCSDYFPVWHCISLGKITHRCGEFAVGTAKLTDDDLCDLWIGLRDFDGIL